MQYGVGEDDRNAINALFLQAFAQQLKNKDIPEGGSKAVVLMEPHPSDHLDPDMFGHNFMVRPAQASAVILQK